FPLKLEWKLRGRLAQAFLYPTFNQHLQGIRIEVFHEILALLVIVRALVLEQPIIKANFSRQRMTGRDPVDYTVSLVAFRVNPQRAGVVGTAQLDNLASFVLDHLITGDHITAAQTDTLPCRQSLPLTRRD